MKERIKKYNYIICLLIIGILYTYIAPQKATEQLLPSQTKSQSDDFHKYESSVDSRVNYHLSLLSRKMQFQKLQATSLVKEVEYLKNSHPKLSLDHKKPTHHSQPKKLQNNDLSLTNQVDAYILQKERERQRQILEEQEEQRYRQEVIQNYKQRAKEAGFEIVIKDDHIVEAKKIN